MSKKEEVLSGVRGFQKSRVILTAVELDFFTRLHGKPAGAEELADELRLESRATTRVLDCLVTFGLLSKTNGRYVTTEEGAYLSSRHPETVRPMAAHLIHLWNNWSHLTETVRRGVNIERKRATEGGETLTAFIGAMHVVGSALSRERAEAYDIERFQCLLDIGGGSGTYTISFLERNPGLSAVLFDLPEVIDMARRRFTAAKLLNRVTLVGGDLYRDDLPTGCDLALVSAIIHQNSPQQNIELYRKVHRALVPGGRLLIRDHIMDEDRLHPPGGALFALNMLVCTDAGDTYSFAEVEETLTEAGFQNVRLVRQGERMDCLVEAKKSAQ